MYTAVRSLETETVSCKPLLSFVRKPWFIIILVGVAIRLVLMPLLSFSYDSNYWAMTMSHLQAGLGLYGLEGYYYTPVWGYIIGLLAPLQEMFLGVDIYGLRVTGAFPLEAFMNNGPFYLSATVTSVEFNFWIKFPIMICDIIVGYLVYRLIKDRSGDEKKAVKGLALWFLCPLTIIVTSVCGMFDVFSVMFTLLSVLLIYHDKCFLGGVTFSFAVLTKFFPGFLIFILVAYVLAKHKNDGLKYRKLAYAILGASIAFVVIMLPQIFDGTFMEAFTFLSSRTGSGGGSSIGTMLVSKTAMLYFTAVLCLTAVIAWWVYKTNDAGRDKAFFMACALAVGALFVYPPSPQYILLFIPFLAYAIVMADRRFTKSWVMISVGGLVMVLSYNSSLLLGLAAHTGWLSVDSVVSVMTAFQSPLVFGVSAHFVLLATGSILVLAGMLWFFYVAFLRGKETDRGGWYREDGAPMRKE